VVGIVVVVVGVKTSSSLTEVPFSITNPLLLTQKHEDRGYWARFDQDGGEKGKYKDNKE
jgi:hypothetical protein